MNLVKWLLGKLAEECGEVVQIAMKSQLFGISTPNPDDNIINEQQLVKELNDIFAVVEMLRKQGVKLEGLNNPFALKEKERKVIKYAQGAVESGELDLDLAQSYYFEAINNPKPIAVLDPNMKMSWEDYSETKKDIDLTFLMPLDKDMQPAKMTNAAYLEYWRMPQSSELFDVFGAESRPTHEWITNGLVIHKGHATTVAGFLNNSDSRILQLFGKNAFNCISIRLAEQDRCEPFIWEQVNETV